jgi:uncharacterized protein DUF5947
VTGSALQRVIARGATRRPPTGAACELCGRPTGDAHRHLLDTSRDDLLCACRACTVLFGRDQASGGRFRLLPDRRVRVPGLAPAALGVPVGLAFFVRHADGSVSAHYPSPAGATRWLVDPRTWATVASGRPELATLAADVEALLVNTARGHSDAWLVPIDDCRRLVAVVRRHWKGLSGGDRVWPEIERFFGDLSELCDLNDLNDLNESSEPNEPRRRDGLPPGG